MPKKTLVEPGDEDVEITEGAPVAPDEIVEEKEVVHAAPEAPPEDPVPVTVVSEVDGRWRLEWTDATGRLRQSWSPHRLETSTLSKLEKLPPHGDDLESALVRISIPVSEQVATLHLMNIWEIKQITYQVMRDVLASHAGAEFIALEARVQRGVDA